jgi:plasmid stabilization system protein ParE
VAKLRYTHWIEDDLLEALAWYEAKSPTLGDKFREDVEETLDLIEAAPERFAFALKHLNVRYRKLRRFPYVVYYQMHGDTPVLFAIVHGASDPSKWLRRISP